MISQENYNKLNNLISKKGARIVAVSKKRTSNEIMKLYNYGHRDFGENVVQELLPKHEQLPQDINWHFIGHLQTNKVKYIAPCIHLIHSVDSEKLLIEINKQAVKNNCTIPCLLQVKIAQEQTKHGFSPKELQNIIMQSQNFTNIELKGLMGMATHTDNKKTIQDEFAQLENLFNQYKSEAFTELSAGMSDDYEIALQHGATLLRLGSVLFGKS